MWNWVSELERLRAAGQPHVLVTVTQCMGSTPRDIGAKMVVLPDGQIRGTIGGGHLEQLAVADALACLSEERSRVARYPLGAKAGQCCGGIMELLMEVLNTGPRLYLFGAGHVGQALCRTLAGTPFEIHLIDERAEWLRSPLVPAEIARHEEDWEQFVDHARWDNAKTFVAIMTHRHDVDEAIIARVIERPAAYIGLIGSRPKWERFCQRLLARGIALEKLARVKCPIGLFLGGKAPQEIAISIGAEILRVYYSATGIEQNPIAYGKTSTFASAGSISRGSVTENR